MSDESSFAGWVILELMGHRRLAGYLTEQEIAGRGFLRLDTPADLEGGTQPASQLYSPASVYCITPTTEDVARAVANLGAPAPVQRWELPALAAKPDYDNDGFDPAADEHEVAGWSDSA